MQTSKKFDVWPFVKAGVCILLFWATVCAFAVASGALIDNYMMLFSLNAGLSAWVLKLCIYSLLLLTMLGILSALVRPWWLLIPACVGGAALYALVCGGGWVTWIGALVLGLIFVWYAFFVVGQMENQIHFSIHPLGDKKALVCTVFAILICVSLGLGYLKDATARNYVLPPELTKYITDATTKTLTGTLNQQADAQIKDKKLTKKQQDDFDKQKNDAITSMNDKMKQSFDDLEKKAAPYKNYIAVMLGIFAFCIFQMFFVLLSMFLSPIIMLLFFIMKVTHFTSEVAEKVEVKHLVL